jgi:hypothetical protein
MNESIASNVAPEPVETAPLPMFQPEVAIELARQRQRQMQFITVCAAAVREFMAVRHLQSYRPSSCDKAFARRICASPMAALIWLDQVAATIDSGQGSGSGR